MSASDWTYIIIGFVMFMGVVISLIVNYSKVKFDFTDIEEEDDTKSSSIIRGLKNISKYSDHIFQSAEHS